MSGRVALTGATGFIGDHLRAELLREGAVVRALTRRPIGGARSGGEQIEWVRGHLGDSQALSRLVDGADLVIHCAGTVRGASAEAFHSVNADGTRALARAARGSGTVSRFLFVSSLAAREPGLSWYAASKRSAEEALEEVAGEALPWAVFRPTAVYGPGDREMQPLFQFMRRGTLPVFGGSDARLSLLHIEDLARAILAWTRTPEPLRGIYEVHDGTRGGYSWDRIARTAEEAWGRKVRTVPVPRALLSSLATLNLAMARLTKRAPMLTPGKVEELRHPDWSCDNTDLCRALDWTPRLDLARALRTDRVLSHRDRRDGA